MEAGIQFFDPSFQGENPLKWIVNNFLGPSVLARSAFCEKHLFEQIEKGAKQYVILASGFDTSAFKVHDKINVFELDKKEVIDEKQKRIKKAGLDISNIHYVKTDFNTHWINDLLSSNFNNKYKTFCSMLGISYYLDKKIFKNIIITLSKIIPAGSAILFDYPNDYESQKEKLNQQLAKGANEEMKSIHTDDDIKKITDDSNMVIHKHLHHKDIDQEYFKKHNEGEVTSKITAPIGVNYVMLVKI